MQQLLVTGWPRQRVFDLGMLLNEHPQVALGVRRFSRLEHLSDLFLLDPQRLPAPLSVETDVRGELLYSRLSTRGEGDGLEVLGDIDVEHVFALDELALRFGSYRALVVLGEPGSDELERWRMTVELARTTERTPIARRVFVMLWEPFAAGEERWLRALLAFLGLPATERLNSAYERLCAAAGAGAIGAAAGDAQAELLAWLQERATTELDQYAPDGRPLPPVLGDQPLTAAEVEARALERGQLLSEQAEGSVWQEEGELLGTRYREAMRHLHTRGRRVMSGILTGGDRFSSAELNVNIVCPEPIRQPIGRAEVFEQLATHLSRFCNVRLFATQRPPPALRGVELRLGTIDDELLSSGGEVVLYPGDARDADRLLAADRAIMLLDGFEPPLDQTVLANLDAAREVIACSEWLCALARERGASAIHVPLGLDRGMFAPGPPAEQRGLHITGVAEAADWMGCEVLSEALVRVREARPEVAVTLFGSVPADGATSFVSSPSLSRVANVLRSSAVHLSTAREEGFGYVGAGALSCGAALVSTANKGSAEYAIDRRTALVGPSDDPQQLADLVLDLLADGALRTRLAAAGSDHVRRLLRPWIETARAIAVALDAH